MSSPACVAFDVGGTTTRAALVEDGRLSGRVEHATTRGDGLAGELARIYRELGGDGLPVGVAIPGPLSSDGRGVAFTGNVALRDYPLSDLLERELGVDVQLDDDANCAALAEAVVGAAVGSPSSMTIVVGTGVGGGIVMDGELVRGTHWTAGEVGHVQLDRNGPTCACGRRGCLEALANGAALAARAGTADAASAFAAARAGDGRANAAVRETAYWIAVGVAAVATIVDPACIVLAGGVGRQPEVVAGVVEVAPGLCIEPIGDSLSIRPASLGDDSGLIGAALVAAGRST